MKKTLNHLPQHLSSSHSKPRTSYINRVCNAYSKSDSNVVGCSNIKDIHSDSKSFGDNIVRNRMEELVLSNLPLSRHVPTRSQLDHCRKFEDINILKKQHNLNSEVDVVIYQTHAAAIDSVFDCYAVLNDPETARLLISYLKSVKQSGSLKNFLNSEDFNNVVKVLSILYTTKDYDVNGLNLHESKAIDSSMSLNGGNTTPSCRFEFGTAVYSNDVRRVVVDMLLKSPLYSELDSKDRGLLFKFLTSRKVFCLMHNISSRTVTIETSKYSNSVAFAMHMEDHVEAGEFHQHRSALEQQPVVSNYLGDKALSNNVEETYKGVKVATSDCIFVDSLDKEPKKVHFEVDGVDVKSDVNECGTSSQLLPFIEKLNRHSNYCLDVTKVSDTCLVKGKSFDHSKVTDAYRSRGLKDTVILYPVSHGDSEARNHPDSVRFYRHVFMRFVENGHKNKPTSGDELFKSIEIYRRDQGSDFRKHTIPNPQVYYDDGAHEFGKSVKSNYPGKLSPNYHSSGLITDGRRSSDIFEPFNDMFK